MYKFECFPEQREGYSMKVVRGPMLVHIHIVADYLHLLSDLCSISDATPDALSRITVPLR